MGEIVFDGSKLFSPDNLHGEFWSKISCGEGRYEISNMGRACSITKYAHGAHYPRKKRKILKQFYNKTTGYYQIVMGKNDGEKRKKIVIHREVAIQFIPNPGCLPEVNHKKGIKVDNRASELEWVTRPQNIQHAYDNGLIKVRLGQDNKNSILTNEQVLDIYNSDIGPRELSRQLNMTYSLVAQIKNGTKWTHITGGKNK